MRYYNKEARRLSDLCAPYYYYDEKEKRPKLRADAPQHIKIADKKWKQIYDDIEAELRKDWEWEVLDDSEL